MRNTLSKGGATWTPLPSPPLFWPPFLYLLIFLFRHPFLTSTVPLPLMATLSAAVASWKPAASFSNQVHPCSLIQNSSTWSLICFVYISTSCFSCLLCFLFDTQFFFLKWMFCRLKLYFTLIFNFSKETCQILWLIIMNIFGFWLGYKSISGKDWWN